MFRFLMMWREFTLSIVLISSGCAATLRAETCFREYQKSYPTYPYSDPDPVPTFTDFYPGFRFDGFTDRPVEQKWNVVEISNDYLTLTILPQIGGKIWDVTEKTTGRSVVYANPVIKFRDIAMRGPWTSGGIEMNVGIIGHTPNCSSPVDYTVRKNDDGSVSCFIGALDLITRSRWTTEIRLPDNAAVFAMKITWQNSSGQTQPYYTWTNVGMPASEDLQYVNHGTEFVGHDGEISEWPIDPATGKDLSWYKNNDFGSYKSYHIVGQMRDFFGVCYHESDTGTVCVIPAEGKRGRKIWMWGHSREGMIWEDLLTDPPGGQYVEIQSGRLFNQTSTASSKTPFKHREFSPYSHDAWTEWWFPVHGISGYNSAGIMGAMNVNITDDNGESNVNIGVCPTVFLETVLRIYSDDRLILSEPVSLKPMCPVKRSFSLNVEDPSRLRVVLGDETKSDQSLIFTADESRYVLHRPWRSDETSDGTHVHGDTACSLYLAGREKMRERKYKESDDLYLKCLEKDAFCVPALAGLAENANRAGNAQMAVDYCHRALRIDLYDAAINYQAGLAYANLGMWVDAEESFCVAAISDTCRTAALIELARVYIHEHRFQRAVEVLDQVIGISGTNMDAQLLKLCACRISGENEDFSVRESENILRENPLFHAVRIERFLAGNETPENVRNAIRWEFPHETYLEMVCFHERLGRRDDAAKITELAIGTEGIQRTELLYWLAYVTQNPDVILRAESEPASFCFPFRAESRPVFRWALEQNPDGERPNVWKTRYYSAILEAYHQNTEKAIELLKACQNEPDEATFYLFRGRMIPDTRSADFRRAFELCPEDPRTAIAHAETLENAGKSDDAMVIINEYAEKYPLNPKLILMRARGLLRENREEDAWKYLRNVTFLPNEGSIHGRVLFHEAALLTAANMIKSEQWDRAAYMVTEAKSWPENLGSGKPYPVFCDERSEDWMVWIVATKTGNPVEADAALKRILEPVSETHRAKFASNPYDRLLTALAMRASGKPEDAREILTRAVDQKNRAIDLWSLDYFDGKPIDTPESPVGRVLMRIR
ncbi:MAG: DUF5107 domain-containing protein [Planctomycetia bacterium]|nr:DUF5107 domain-containing protein [Planctomycetia bacterium]